MKVPLALALGLALLGSGCMSVVSPEPRPKPIARPVPPKPGQEIAKPFPMVWIAPGTFTMGTPPPAGAPGESNPPPRRVTIARGLWMGRHEVTQAEYTQVVRIGMPSRFPGNPRHPVDSIDWLQAVTFCKLLTEQERAAGRLPENHAYRLPTEAEWEYACRAGSVHRFPWGDEADRKRLKALAWFEGNVCTPKEPSGESAQDPSGRYGRTQNVERKRPNAWGLYDMRGNVWEWCLDAWTDQLPGGDFTNPLEAVVGLNRVDRGGGWDSPATLCANDARVPFPASSRSPMQGFRVVLAPTR